MFTLISINCKVTSKEELISSTIQDIFKETMEESLFCFKKTSFIVVVSIFHEKLYTVSEEYNNFNFDYSSEGQFLRSFTYYFVNEIIKKMTMDETIIEFVNSEKSCLYISTADFESKYSIIINKKNEKLVKYLLENYKNCFYKPSIMENCILDMTTNKIQEVYGNRKVEKRYHFNTITNIIYKNLCDYSFIIGTKKCRLSTVCDDYIPYEGFESDYSINYFYLIKD